MPIRGPNRVFRCGHCSLQATAPAFICPRRTFTSSNPQRKDAAVPTFTEVSTPELQDLLSKMRENVFFPAHLSKAHQALVFGSRHRQTLEEEPITVEISGEEFQLKHINRKEDQAGTVGSLLKLMSLMKDKKDWDNLPMFLEGLKTSGRRLKPKYWEKLVRKAGQAGQQQTILECARRVSRTGFVLRDLHLVREVMRWTRDLALSAGWTAESTKKSLAMAEQVADLLEDEKHCGGKFVSASDPRARPEVVGVLLQLAAAHAKLSSGNDEDGKVEIYSKRLLGTLARNVDLKEGLPVGRAPWTSNALLCYITPIISGMREAADIFGPKSELAKQLREREPALAAIAANEYENILAEDGEVSQRAGVSIYNRFLGSQEL